jgi:hypothetical protein
MRVGINEEFRAAPHDGQEILSSGILLEQLGHLIIDAIFSHLRLPHRRCAF